MAVKVRLHTKCVQILWQSVRNGGDLLSRDKKVLGKTKAVFPVAGLMIATLVL